MTQPAVRTARESAGALLLQRALLLIGAAAGLAERGLAALLRRPRLLLAGAGALLLLLGFVGVVLIARALMPSEPPLPVGRLEIVKAMLSVGDAPLKPGDTKQVLVEIRRIDFQGPVEVRIEDLPDGIHAGKKKIPPNQDKGDLSLTVSYYTEPIQAQLRVVATAGERTASKLLPVTVVQVPHKK
jgi:hypothetical protein